eukprot:gene16247-22019_t
MVIGLIGDCHSEMGNMEEAESSYQKAANLSSNPYSTPVMLKKLGHTMATSLKNLSAIDAAQLPNGTKYRVGIVVSRWNEEVTGALLKGAVECLTENGVKAKNITTVYVPGTYELALGAQLL